MKLSVVLATFNEEANLAKCLASVVEIADEMVIVDGSSTDRTVEIGREFGAKVVVTENHPVFHINKQKALELAQYPWILQLDADEHLSKALAREIKAVIEMTDEEINEYQRKLVKRRLFLRHQQLLMERDGQIGLVEGEYAGFFVPRLNYFLGGYLRHGGVYPDGVIRLVKKGKAYFPAKDVHEQMVIDGRVGWLAHDLLHYDSPTWSRYIQRNSRYIDLIATELKTKKVGKNLLEAINYGVWKPMVWFLTVTIRHKGILDGWRGIVFGFFSALRFPRAYWRYLTND